MLLVVAGSVQFIYNSREIFFWIPWFHSKYTSPNNTKTSLCYGELAKTVSTFEYNCIGKCEKKNFVQDYLGMKLDYSFQGKSQLTWETMLIPCTIAFRSLETKAKWLHWNLFQIKIQGGAHKIRWAHKAGKRESSWILNFSCRENRWHNQSPTECK